MGGLRQKFFHLPLWAWIVLGLSLAGGLLYIAMNQPQHASWRYGACKVFLEHSVRFPETIDVIVGNDTANSALIAFSDINAYGAEQVKVFECYYSTGTNGQPSLSKITLDRRPIPDAQITKFNQMLPIILTQELDTALPDDFPRKLEDFRK